MKKIFSIILVWAAVLTSYAQSGNINYDIAYLKKVFYKNLYQGTKNDSLLAINTAGQAFFIKQSDLGGHVDPFTLQQVVDAGGLWYKTDGSQFVNLFSPSLSADYFIVRSADINGSSNINLSKSDIYSTNLYATEQSTIGQKLGKFNMSEASSASGEARITQIRFRVPAAPWGSDSGEGNQGARLFYPAPDTPGEYNFVLKVNGYSANNKGEVEIPLPTVPDASASAAGKVNNTPLQELGGVDKLINGVRIGKGAGTGNNNLAVGMEAMPANTTGNYNTAVGSYAMYVRSTGNYNTAIGNGSMFSLTAGESNTSLGSQSMNEQSTVSETTAIGSVTLIRATGTGNSALGYRTGRRVTSGEYNTLIGHFSGEALTTGSNNTFLGRNSGTLVTTGSNNTIIGEYQGTPAMSNTVVLSDGLGAIAIQKLTGGEITAPNLTTALIGTGGAKSLTTKEYVDAAIGGVSVPPASATVSGTVNNVSLQELGGADKLINAVRIGRGGGNIVGNTALGDEALQANTTGSATALGNSAGGSNTTGAANTYVGNVAAFSGTTASKNTVVGDSALYTNVSGEENTAVGVGVMSGVVGTTAAGNSRNTAVGAFAGNNILTGSDNTLIGAQTYPSSTTLRTGNFNTFVGDLDNNLVTGNYNTFIGKVTSPSTTLNNYVIIGDGQGNVAFQKNTTGETTAPNLTTALIGTGGAKSLTTKEYVDGAVSASLTNTAFAVKTYSSTLSVAHDTANPNFQVSLTGNLSLTMTGTANGNAGLVNLYFAGSQVATLNGAKALTITGTGVMVPVYFIHDADGVKWYNADPSVDTSAFAAKAGTVLYHIALATNAGTFSNTGTAITGTGTAFTANMVGARIKKANGEVAIIATVTSSTAATTTTAFPTNSTGTAFEVTSVAYRVNADGSTEEFDKTGFRVKWMEVNGNLSYGDNNISVRANGNFVSNGYQLKWGDVEITNDGRIKQIPPSYASDAAAAADGGLSSGQSYIITGSTVLHVKP